MEATTTPAAATATETPGAAGRGLTGRWGGKGGDLRVEIVVFPIIAKVTPLAAALPLLVWESEVGPKTTTLL